MNDKEFLFELKKYIEEMVETLEGEWGVGKSLEQIIADGGMPPLYDEALRRISIATGETK